MKLPNSGSGNGYYGHHQPVTPYFSEPVDMDNSTDSDNSVPDDEFSEYLWMEHEEEFDKQVMQELEEEALMEQCIEAMLEDERELRNLHNQVLSAIVRGAAFSACSCPEDTQSQSAAQSTTLNSSICDAFKNLSVQENVANKSTLNPNAQEFVPQTLSDEEDEKSVALLPVQQ